MKIDLDDPNLTAFALGELSGAEEAAMQKAIAASAEAQARVEELQALATLIRAAFRHDLQEEAEKRRDIVPLLQQGNFWSDWRWAPLAAAALLAISAIVAAIALSPSRPPAAVADGRSKAARSDALPEMEVDTSPEEQLASNAAPPDALIPSGPNASAADERRGENPFSPAASNPISTFPIQVDTASYKEVRQAINSGSRPAKEAVRIEEMINYFRYDYPQPEGDRPFSINLDAATCPWQPSHQLVRIGLKGREVPAEKRGGSNLVFLLDVSGSMQLADRLPLVKRAVRLLLDRLTMNDRVALVVYAGASGVALESTPGDRKEEIARALEELKAGDLTDGIEGIELAYRIAADNFINEGVNRVIVVTDGELNVGVADERELVRLAKKKAKAGISLTFLGVGDDRVKAAAMQKTAGEANGDYAYLESVEEGRKVLMREIHGTRATIAEDVEVQVEFNPARVTSYRLIGYENRLRKLENSSSDTNGNGEIGAGYCVTALYEVVPAGLAVDATAASETLNYRDANPMSAATKPGPKGGELLTVKLRHKQPGGAAAVTTEHSLETDVVDWSRAPADFRFAAAVAEFGMILRDSPHRGNGTLAGVLKTAEGSKGADPSGYRAGFVDLVRQAQALAF